MDITSSSLHYILYLYVLLSFLFLAHSLSLSLVHSQFCCRAVWWLAVSTFLLWDKVLGWGGPFCVRFAWWWWWWWSCHTVISLFAQWRWSDCYTWLLWCTCSTKRQHLAVKWYCILPHEPILLLLLNAAQPAHMRQWCKGVGKHALWCDPNSFETNRLFQNFRCESNLWLTKSLNTRLGLVLHFHKSLAASVVQLRHGCTSYPYATAVCLALRDLCVTLPRLHSKKRQKRHSLIHLIAKERHHVKAASV